MKDNRICALRGIAVSMLILGTAALICGSNMPALASFSAAASMIGASNRIKKDQK